MAGTRRITRHSPEAPSTEFGLAADLISSDVANNRWTIRCYITAINRGNTSSQLNLYGEHWGIIDGVTSFRTRAQNPFLPSGYATNSVRWEDGPYDVVVNALSDGRAPFSLSGGARGVYLYQEVYAGSWSLVDSAPFVLPTLVGVPVAPSGVTATRVSDTDVTVAWSQGGHGNSQPTQHTVQRRVNGGSWADVVTVAATTNVAIGAAANQKVEYRVRASNSAGTSAWSAVSAPLYTTPAAPSSVVAAKDSNLDINLSWVSNVAYAEHVHVVEYSTNGGSTWSPLATVPGGTSTYKHVSPNPSTTHRYRVAARTTASPPLTSGWAVSGTVQLLAPPDKPSIPALGAFADKGRDFVFPWTHNPVDTTAQTAYEVEYSTNGGSSWTSTTKVTSTTSSYTVAADTYSSGAALTLRVRTWGQATSGGSETTGASPWSDPVTVTFKTRPVATVVSPADASTWTGAMLVVAPGFSQAEGASFVQATITLEDSSGVVESRVTNALSPVTFDTRVLDGGEYSVSVTVLDSHGIVSDPAASDFDVAYTLPVEAGVTVTYLREEGVAQLDLVFAEAGSGEAAAVAVTVSRFIGDEREDILTEYPIDGALTIFDRTPTINGTNTYRVRTISGDGATVDVIEDLPLAEPYWAFLSTGPGFTRSVSFFGNLTFDASPSRSTALARASGRRRPIALFGAARGLVVSGSADLIPGMGSSVRDIEDFILDAGIVCYRDPSGRRMFGTVTGSLSSPSSLSSRFTYTVTEAS